VITTWLRGLDESTVDPEDARRLADEILRRADQQPPSDSLIQTVWDWLIERFNSFVAALTFSGAGALVAYIMLAVIAVAVAVVIIRLRRTVERDAKLAFSASAQGRTTPDEWDAAAERAALAGRFDDAIRCRLRSVLAALDASGVLDELDGRTSGEYRSAAKQVLPLRAAEAFDQLADAFDDVWYGDLPADERLNAQAQELARQVRQQVSSS